MTLAVITTATVFLFSLSGTRGLEAANEHWDYVTVRDGAHMFYWLYENPAGYKSAPLILWLQGGPGGSSTGFGNFAELGPLDLNLKPRNTTWLSVASLLFVDNPVGAGYSYVDRPEAFTTDVAMIAKDMVALLKTFFSDAKAGQKYQDIPFFIFCESYGGKMTAAISMALYKAIESREIKCNFKGLALGDSWIQPVYSTNSWAPYLYANSLVDQQGLVNINASAFSVQKSCQQGDWKKATAQWGTTQDILEEATNGVNFYNILQWGGSEPLRKASKHSRNMSGVLDRVKARMLGPLHADPLTDLMNGPIRKKLGIIPDKVTWGGQSEKVFEYMTGDFMKPVVDTVNSLIQNTSLYVVVYSGQLDLIVCTPGTEQWIQELEVYSKFSAEKRVALLDPVTKLTSGFEKTFKNFSLYWILSAGHMVPADNGSTALEMVRRILSYPNRH